MTVLLAGGVGLFSPVAWADDPVATTEVELAWQDAKYNVDPPASAGNGTLLNAEAHLSRNFDHATDVPQSGGKRAFTFVVENGYVTDIPKYCVESEKTSLSGDRKSLSCEYEADATHGVASRFLIPVTVDGPADSLVRAKITDEAGAGKSAVVKAVKIIGGEGLNPLVTAQDNTDPIYAGRGMRFVTQVLSAPNSRKPAGPVTFDMKIDWAGSGTLSNVLDTSAISFKESAFPSRTSKNKGIDTSDDLNGATWKAKVDPADPWLFHVSVDGFNAPDPRYRNYTNGQSAGGWLNLSSAQVSLPFKDSATAEQKLNAGNGSATITLSNVSYTTADGKLTTDAAVADQNTEDNQTVFAYSSGRGRSYAIGYLSHYGNYAPNGAPVAFETMSVLPASLRDGQGVTVPGGVAFGASNIFRPSGPISFCNILPKGQGAHFTGEWFMYHNIGDDDYVGDPRKVGHVLFTQWEGLENGLAKDTSKESAKSKALQSIPQGVKNGTLEYYVGDTSLDFNADCNGSDGWTRNKPADMTTVSGMRITGTDQSDVKQGTTIASTHFITVYKVNKDTPAKTAIWSSSSSTLDAAQPMTPISARPTSTVNAPYADAPAGYPGTNGGIDRFSVIGAAARHSIEIASANQNPEPKANVPVSIQWGAYGAASKDYPGKLTVTLPAGTTYVAGSASAELGEPSVKGQTLTWEKVTKGNVYQKGTFMVVAGGPAGAKTLSSSYVIDPVAGNAGDDAGLIKALTVRSSTRYVLNSSADTIVTVSAPKEFAVNDYTGKVSFDIMTQNDDSVTQDYVSTLSVLPYAGDGRGTDLKSAGATFVCQKVTPAAGAEVYYSSAEAKGIDRSPVAGSNGGVAAPGAGWKKLTGSDIPAGTTALWFINKKVAAGIELNHSVECTYTGDKTVNPRGAKFGFSAVSAAASTKLKTIEASTSTVVAPGSPLKVDKAWEANPVGDDGLVHFNGTVKVAQGNNGATNLTITDDGGQGLTDVKLTAVKAVSGNYNIEKVAENQWKVVGHVSPVAEFTYEGTAKLERGLEGPVDITNAIRVSSDENPKDSSLVCTPNTDVDSDTDQCDLVQTRISPTFAVKKSGGKTVQVGPDMKEFVQSYVVSVSNTGLVGGTSAGVVDRPGVVDGLRVSSLSVDGTKVSAGPDGSFAVSPGVKLGVGESKEFKVEVTYGVDLAGMSAASWKRVSTCETTSGTAGGGARSGLVNTVHMDGDDVGDKDGASNNTACSTVTGSAGISVVKKINGQDANDAPGVVVAPGSMMDVSFVVTNTGSMPLSELTVVDSVITDPKAITCPASELAAGESMTCTAKLAAPAPGVQHTNTARAEGKDPFGVVVSDEDPANATTPAFTVTKVAKSAPVKTSGEAGTRLAATFEVSVANTGLVEAVSSDVIDTPATPAGLKIVDVRVNGTSVDTDKPFVVIPASKIAAGQTRTASVVVTYEVVANLTQSQWKSLSVCSTEKAGDPSKGLFNSVTSDQDVTGANDNDACVPVADRSKLAHTGADLASLPLLAGVLLAAGGLSIMATRRRA
ncbi:hypothetical protein G7Y41_03590 [Schaalia sp. ZJ405]|uniref:DUF7507 domain-containing protein n=1 Tax=Schaalia sp. ZJ405 TaxID=2709403 RepID=UPI0013EC1247|nr:hypothetical protein [Schaalia sp. ZJ405]QPK81911.1 hypothetical protein G7Y41_03590 [Schaalia sp. ZJ405]